MDSPFYQLLILWLLLVSSSVTANVYKYQDANGNWHFTDKALSAEKDSAKLDNISRKKRNKIKDFAEKLEKHYTPETAIERSTLSVVKIETNMGSGSGFFISENGYILQNGTHLTDLWDLVIARAMPLLIHANSEPC